MFKPTNNELTYLTCVVLKKQIMTEEYHNYPVTVLCQTNYEIIVLTNETLYYYLCTIFLVLYNAQIYKIVESKDCMK